MKFRPQPHPNKRANYLRWRKEDVFRNRLHDRNLIQQPETDRQHTVFLRPRLRRQTIRHLLLQENVDVLRLVGHACQRRQQLRTATVRQIRHATEGFVPHQCVQIQPTCIRLRQRKQLVILEPFVPQIACQTMVQFNGLHTRADRQHPLRQRSRARADFQNRVPFHHARATDKRIQHVRINQKILPQPAAGMKFQSFQQCQQLTFVHTAYRRQTLPHCPPLHKGHSSFIHNVT